MARIKPCIWLDNGQWIFWLEEICKEIKPVNPKGYQRWIFVDKTDAEVEAPILCSPDVNSWLIGKDPDAGKDWGQEEKGMTENEMVGCYHQLDVHGFGWTPGVGDGQGGLACCGSWGCKELDMAERLNWTIILKQFKYKYTDRLSMIWLFTGYYNLSNCEFTVFSLMTSAHRIYSLNNFPMPYTAMLTIVLML